MLFQRREARTQRRIGVPGLTRQLIPAESRCTRYIYCVHMYMYVRIYVCVCIYVCMYVCTNEGRYICMYVFIYVCMYVKCMYV